MGVGIYYFYHGFGLNVFEGRHIRIVNTQSGNIHLIKKYKSVLPMGDAIDEFMMFS
jgi:hypothetical protein